MAEDEATPEGLAAAEAEVQRITREAERRAREQLEEVNRAFLEGAPDPGATELQELDPERQADLDDRRQDIDLKRTYAKGLFGLLFGQMIIADGVFLAYAWAGENWHLSAGVIQVWLAATLVEVIGVVTVVTRYLFPRRDASA